jgi:hypothetical protein
MSFSKVLTKDFELTVKAGLKSLIVLSVFRRLKMTYNERSACQPMSEYIRLDFNEKSKCTVSLPEAQNDIQCKVCMSADV